MPEDKKMAKEDQEMAGDGEVRSIICLIRQIQCKMHIVKNSKNKKVLFNDTNIQ